MRNTLTFSFILCMFSAALFGQTKTAWFPSGLNIRPFTANTLETRVGSLYLLNQKRLQLNIGTSSDIYREEYGDKTLSFGADMFTFTRLRSENNFRFPVETIDYFFGVNFGYKIVKEDKQYGFRLRVSHISAHIVDGRYNAADASWRDNLLPFVYSREFIEAMPFYQIGTFRGYAGFTYLFHVIPNVIGKEIYQAGFDYYWTSFPSKVFTPFVAYDFRVNKIEKYTGNNTLMAGIKFGRYDANGFSVILSYYSGKSIHGEYFNLSEHYASFGINMDL